MRILLSRKANSIKVKSQRFRNDLFYRLNIFTIRLLPLRERRSDIIPLAEHFLYAYIKGRGLSIKGFSEESKDMLINYEFPGNARELRNIVERAAILCRSGLIEPGHIRPLKTSQDMSSYIPSYIKPSDEK